MSFSTKIEVIFPGLIHIQYDTQYEVSSTFLRLQEFYESPYPEINGKYFTLDKFMDLYAKDKGNFTYTSDWSGFNVPGDVADSFNDIYSEKMIPKEYDLFDIITEHTCQWDKYYIIASSKDGGRYGAREAIDVMKHEIAHGMWYLVPEYKEAMSKIIDPLVRDFPCFGETILKMGYGERVITDETQAYLATSSMTYLADDGFPGCDIPWQSVLEIQRTFEQYYEEMTANENTNFISF